MGEAGKKEKGGTEGGCKDTLCSSEKISMLIMLSFRPSSWAVRRTRCGQGVSGWLYRVRVDMAEMTRF